MPKIQYSKTFKQKIVDRVLEDNLTYEDVAFEKNVPLCLVTQWCNDFRFRPKIKRSKDYFSIDKIPMEPIPNEPFERRIRRMEQILVLNKPCKVRDLYYEWNSKGEQIKPDWDFQVQLSWKFENEEYVFVMKKRYFSWYRSDWKMGGEYLGWDKVGEYVEEIKNLV